MNKITLPSDNYDLLLLADWLEEFGSFYDIIKANAIRNNNYSLDFRDKCTNIWNGGRINYGHGFGLIDSGPYSDGQGCI